MNIALSALLQVTLVMALEYSQNTCYHICIVFDLPINVLFSIVARYHDRQYILWIQVGPLALDFRKRSRNYTLKCVMYLL